MVTQMVKPAFIKLIPLLTPLISKPPLEAVWEEAEPGTFWGITRYRDAAQHLRTQLLRILHKAGLTAWPKLFQNLRASRATELVAEYPAHVGTAGLGHSTVVASKHYWQVTDADFERAIQGGAKSGAPAVAQNPAQQPSAQKSEEPQMPPEALSAGAFAPPFADRKCFLNNDLYAPSRTRTWNPLIKSQLLCRLS
jgi:hypothetical protein